MLAGFSWDPRLNSRRMQGFALDLLQPDLGSPRLQQNYHDG